MATYRLKNTGDVALICHDPATGEQVGIEPGAEVELTFRPGSNQLVEVVPAKPRPATIEADAPSA